ncbi:MAG: hypothetical protein WCW78_00805 [Candidatus Paceibacterota bacterium]|jgi:hypothetical protein
MMSILFPFALFLLFAPGYLATYFMPWVRDSASRIAFSLVTSITFGIILSFAVALFKLSIYFVFPFFLILLLVGEVYMLRARRHTIISDVVATSRDEWKQIGVAALFSLFAAAFIFIPHMQYKWPIHADEWWVVGTIQNVEESRGLNVHPYTFEALTNDKPGFSSYIAGSLSLIRANPIYAWPYLPSINIFLISFVISLLLFRHTRNKWASWCVPFFFAALRSNIFMLGWWFFVPSMFSFVLVLPLLLSLSDWVESLQGRMWAFTVFIALSLVYFPYAVIAGMSILFSVRKTLFQWKRIFALLLGFCIAIIVVVGISASPYREYWKMPGVPHLYEPIARYIQAFFVPIQATISPAGIFLNITNVIGITTLVLGVAGFFFLRKKPWSRTLLYGVVICGLNLILIWFCNVSFMMFHQRAFYLFSVLLVPCAAVGTTYFFELGFWKNLGKWRIPVIGATGGGIFFLLFSGYFILPQGTYLFPLVDAENATAMQWLKSREELRGMKVVSNTAPGSVITPLTRLVSKVNMLTTQTVSASINMEELNTLNVGTCEEKKIYITKMEGDIIYLPVPQACPFFEKIYETSHVFIYRVHKNR